MQAFSREHFVGPELFSKVQMDKCTSVDRLSEHAHVSICLSEHAHVCSFPCACSDRQTDRNINMHVLTDRQTDRQYILASVYTKTRQQIKM